MEVNTVAGLDPAVQAKWERLLTIIRDFQSAVVAFSGGVDSGLLSAAAFHTLGDRMLAVNVHSPVNPPGEETSAALVADTVGFPFEIFEYDDLKNPSFVRNPQDRCYYCKLARLTQLQELAKNRGYRMVLEGSNASDGGDYRPGMRAVADLGVRSPLAEAGLQKNEIRQISRVLGLPVWERPSAPCLATRFPYGIQITYESLEKIATAEKFLIQRGFEPVRVRYLTDEVRIEVDPAEFNRLISMREEVVKFIKPLGFHYVTIDLQGYRQGSMNEVLK